jgi:glutaminyl-peptide cyclotransferase
MIPVCHWLCQCEPEHAPEAQAKPVAHVGWVATLLAVLLVLGPIAHAAEPEAPRAFGYLTDLCRIGPRWSGSQGMDTQLQKVSEHFSKLGGVVRYQTFDAPHPLTGNPVRMNNVIVSWHPRTKERVLLCCHYDTRPLPDNDPDPEQRRAGRFLGANDGASGVALLMELAHHMKDLSPKYGVDFVLFDGEELIYGNKGEFFLGSTHFAEEYAKATDRQTTYVAGVLVDMIGDKNFTVYQEINSLKYAPKVVESVWGAARRAGVKEFIAKPRHEVRDDHIPLNEIAKIPTVDLIDFDYPHWHTARDVPSNCSGGSLAKTGRVVLEWLKELPDF